MFLSGLKTGNAFEYGKKVWHSVQKIKQTAYMYMKYLSCKWMQRKKNCVQLHDSVCFQSERALFLMSVDWHTSKRFLISDVK